MTWLDTLNEIGKQSTINTSIDNKITSDDLEAELNIYYSVKNYVKI